MSVFVLKLIAVVTMLVDHSGILLNRFRLIDRDVYILMRTVGRMAFPIYAFLMAEGFRHLKEDPKRLKKHLLMLFAVWVVSEPVFDLFLDGVWKSTEHQSVILTLLLGFLGLWLSESYRDRPLLRFGILLLAAVPGYLFSTDYGAAGVLLVEFSGIYLDRLEDMDFGQRIVGVFLVIFLYYLSYLIISGKSLDPAVIWLRFKAMDVYNIPHLVLVPVLASYRGRLGYRSKVLHRGYQWFYPAHLACLCAAAMLLK